MMTAWIAAVRESIGDLPSIAVLLSLCAASFFALAIGVKGLAGALKSARAAGEETRINAILAAVDLVTVGPLLTVLAAAAGVALRTWGLQLEAPRLWTTIGPIPTLFATVFVGDFIGYWRHRLQHSPWLWPAHAVHHSDTQLSWFSLERMHPVDRLGTLGDTILLGALGFPAWALIGNVMVRHYYGYLVHADVPWTLGKANWLINSPAMHRWHHARDIEGSGYNFATVFSVFDRLFGTYYQPGPCDAPLGVREPMGRGVVGQYLHPLKVWFGIARPGMASAPVAAQTLAPPTPQ